MSVSVFELLKVPSYLMPCISATLAYFVYDYFGPILGLRLAELGLSETEVGLFFCLCSAYLLGCLMAPYLPKTVHKKVWIIVGVLVQFPL